MKWLAIATLLAVAGCNDKSQEGMLRAVEAQGLTEARVEDKSLRSFVACGDDLFALDFSAINQHGKRVHGFVCCGALKARTVRF